MIQENSHHKRLALFALGPEYKRRSGLMVGELYNVADRQHRLGWSLLADYTARGYTITIRPATAAERAWAERETARWEEINQSLKERAARPVTDYDKYLR